MPSCLFYVDPGPILPRWLASTSSRDSLSSSSASRTKWSPVTWTKLPCIVSAAGVLCLSVIIVAAAMGVKLKLARFR